MKKAEDASLAKTRFLNNMSHDIRTPMNVILGYAQLMEDELKGKELPEASEHLKKLQQAGNLLLSIINNVLDMARIESGRISGRLCLKYLRMKQRKRRLHFVAR